MKFFTAIRKLWWPYLISYNWISPKRNISFGHHLTNDISTTNCMFRPTLNRRIGEKLQNISANQRPYWISGRHIWKQKCLAQSEALVVILDFWSVQKVTTIDQLLTTFLPSCPLIYMYYFNEAKLDIHFWSTKLDQDHFCNISGKFHEILFRRFGWKVKADK